MNIAVLVRLARSTDCSSVHRRPVGGQHVPDERDRAGAHPGGGRVVAHDQGVAGLEADQGLEHQGGHRVGHRDQAEHHPDRAGDLGDPAVVGRAGADPGAALEGPVDLQAGEAVLEGLVGHVADPGLGHGGRGQLLGPVGHGAGDVVQQRLDPVLGPAGQVGLGGGGRCHGRVDRRVDVGREHVLLQVAARLPGLGGGVPAQRPQHRQAGRRVVAAQPAQAAVRQDQGGHVGVGVGAGRAGPAVEQAELAAEHARPQVGDDPVGVEVRPLHLQADLAAGDQVALGAGGPLGHDPLAPGVAAALQVGVQPPRVGHPEHGELWPDLHAALLGSGRVELVPTGAGAPGKSGARRPCAERHTRRVTGGTAAIGAAGHPDQASHRASPPARRSPCATPSSPST